MILEVNSQSKLSSLSSLVSALDNKNYELAVDQAHKFVFDEQEFDNYAFWNESHYTRNCIARNAEYELVLLCWEPGQKTPNHCHNGQECWVKVITGDFEEEMYSLNEATGRVSYTETKTLSQHEVTSVDDHTVFHTLQNTSRFRAMTLHLYMKPIDQCRYVNQETGEMKTASLCYYSKDGEIC